MNNTNDETRAFIEELYKKHYRDMMTMISKDALWVSMAEDIVQDTFAEAMRNAEELLTYENPGDWLMETAKQKMAASQNHFMKRDKREVMALEVEISGMEADCGFAELSFLVNQALTLHEKTLFYKYYYGGYSARELADLENITEGAFKIRMLRLRRRLQKRIRAESKKRSRRRPYKI